jgi:hypothetical protein
MIVKSFRSQLQSLYSLAAYQATGMMLPCLCKPFVPKNDSHTRLSFRVRAIGNR